MSKKIAIGKIKTRPLDDPYVNIEGVKSRTFLKLDPRSRTVWVEQEYQDNATPMSEWNSLIVTWCVHSRPTQKSMRQWIVDNMNLLQTICGGFEKHWNGNNMVGRYSEQARIAIENIEFDFDNGGTPTPRSR